MDTEGFITEGKTKKLERLLECVRLQAKDDITAGDGKKHDLLSGKAELATRTCVNVFRLLGTCGVPVAFYAQDSPTSLIAPRCEMISLEVVIRREAQGSFLKRNPHVTRGSVFALPLVEMYLKTSGKKFGGIDLPCDDPMLLFSQVGNVIRLYRPDEPHDAQTWTRELHLTPSMRNLHAAINHHRTIAELATSAFRILEIAWKSRGYRLADLKVEFGFASNATLMLADVIDNDSWRVLTREGNNIDKQVYRDGGDLTEVTKNYALVAELTDAFPDLCGEIRSILGDLKPAQHIPGFLLKPNT